MQDPPMTGGAKSKWDIAGEAINTLTTKYAGRIDFGLIMFPDQTGMACVQDGPIYLTVAPAQETMVVSTITGTQPTNPLV